jgi:hypothetical protein
MQRYLDAYTTKSIADDAAMEAGFGIATNVGHDSHTLLGITNQYDKNLRSLIMSNPRTCGARLHNHALKHLCRTDHRLALAVK